MKSIRIGYWTVLLIVLGMLIGVLALVWLYPKETGDKSILTDIPCAAPCWYGIVPGTLMEKGEIIQLLETLPNMGHVWENNTSGGTAIMWFWEQRPWRETGYNSVFLVDGTVHNISLSFDFELTVEDILDKYGLPEAINATWVEGSDYAYIGVNLFYPTQGLQLRVRLPDRPVLEPTLSIFEVVYTVPADSLETWEESKGYDLELQPWTGYGEIDIPDL